MAFKGGYKFSKFEGTAEPVLIECSIPSVVSLKLGSSGRFVPLVKASNRVSAGQPLLKSNESSGEILPCPVNGKITAIDENAINIKSDGTPDIKQVEGYTGNPWEMPFDELFSRFKSTGCSHLLPDLALTLEKFAAVGNVIINSVNNLPTGISFNPEIFGDASLAAGGLRVLRALFPNAVISVTANRRNKSFFSNPEIAEHSRIRIMSDKYPQEQHDLLALDIAGESFRDASGKCSGSVVILEWTDLIQIAETLVLGRPLVDRIVLLAGPGVKKPAWYRIRIGTPFEDLKNDFLKPEEQDSWRIIRGDLFHGVVVEDTTESLNPGDNVITVIREQNRRSLFGFLNPGFGLDSYSKVTVGSFVPFLRKKLDSGVHGGERYCVQCNFCDEVCPVGIYPQLIWKYVDTGNAEMSFRYFPQDCTGCRICGYVCPARIDIPGAVEKAKKLFNEQEKETA